MMAASSGLYAPWKRPRVLLVEDEPLIAMALESVLGDAGYEVVGPATTCEQGLALASRHGIDCALLDIQLRGEDSESIAEMLTERRVPFAVTTGWPDDDLPSALSRSAALLRKPVGLAPLLAAVALMVSGGRAISLAAG